jgi:hypothetical protein
MIEAGAAEFLEMVFISGGAGLHGQGCIARVCTKCQTATAGDTIAASGQREIGVRSITVTKRQRFHRQVDAGIHCKNTNVAANDDIGSVGYSRNGAGIPVPSVIPLSVPT